MSHQIASRGSPLKRVKVVEFEGIGPGPLAGLLLTQLGAEVTMVARPSPGDLPKDLTPREDGLLSRGKRRVVLNLKQEDDRTRALEIVAASDGLIEGNRPGVMERLGLGPDVCGQLNPRLVYGRMTGWGQDGPLAQVAGHDMNYVALPGLMSLTERPGHPPMLPPTVLGDAAGALGFALGMVSGVLAARERGEGCVVGGAIVDGLAMFSPPVQIISASGGFDPGVPSVFHDSPFYDRYIGAAGRYIPGGAIEPPR